MITVNLVNVTEKSYLQDTPHKSKKFSQIQGVVDQGNMISVGKQYVCLVPKLDDGQFQFQKEAKILLSYQDRMVYNHTYRQTNPHSQAEGFSIMPSNVFNIRVEGKVLISIFDNSQPCERH